MPAPARNINRELTGQIISIVCEVWGVSRPDLVSRSRRRPLPWARAQMCEYLRLYARHDSVSCAAICHLSPDRVVKMGNRYTYLMRLYTPFRNNDTEVKRRCKELGCKPTFKS